MFGEQYYQKANIFWSKRINISTFESPNYDLRQESITVIELEVIVYTVIYE